MRHLQFQLVWKFCRARPTCKKHGGRRVAQLEHNISDDKNIWSGVVEGSKWIGVSAFHLSVAVTPLVMRTGKGRETGTGYSKPFVQPKRRPRDVSWSHPPGGTWGEPETPQVHWNWDERQRKETTLKHESWTWSSNQTGQPKQLPEPGVASALSDEGDSGNEDDGTQTNSDATVRPVTLPEGWTVVLNSLRQVVYCHVRSGIASFQMPENPELLNDLKFENGASSGSDNLSQKLRADCKRKLSNRPEHSKLKISRDDHPQRSSQYIENQVMVKSPSGWIDPFQTKLDRRRTTKLTSTAEPMLLKQAALWHGGKIRIDQACEAAAEGMVRQPKAPRILFRSEETRSLSGTRQEHTKSPQTSHSASCVSSSSAVELPQMSGGTCREQSSTDASDSSMCGSNCASLGSLWREDPYIFTSLSPDKCVIISVADLNDGRCAIYCRREESEFRFGFSEPTRRSSLFVAGTFSGQWRAAIGCGFQGRETGCKNMPMELTDDERQKHDHTGDCPPWDWCVLFYWQFRNQ